MRHRQFKRINYILRKIYDLDDCTECQEARTTTRYESLNQVNIQDDEEEVFEKEDFEDYDQSMSNLVLSSREEVGFVFVNPWSRDTLGTRESVISLDLEEYR